MERWPSSREIGELVLTLRSNSLVFISKNIIFVPENIIVVLLPLKSIMLSLVFKSSMLESLF